MKQPWFLALMADILRVGLPSAARSGLITKIVENFDEADTSSDDTESLQEAMLPSTRQTALMIRL